MISEQDVAFYNENGYLVVPNVLGDREVRDLRRVTEAFVESVRQVAEHNEIYDLEDSHLAAEPRVRRIKTPHARHEAYARMVAHPNILAVLQTMPPAPNQGSIYENQKGASNRYFQTVDDLEVVG